MATDQAAAQIDVDAQLAPGMSWADVQDEYVCGPSEKGDAAHAGDDDIPKLFVAPISRTMTVEELKKVFEDAVGPVQDCTILIDKVTGVSRGCAFVTLFSKAEAEQAIAKLHLQMTLPNCDKPFEVLFARTKQYEEPLASAGPQDNRQLFFARAKFNPSEEDMKEVFSPYGEVEEVLIFKDKRTQQNKGCGFVKMATRQQATDALDALDGKVAMPGAKESLSVKWADPDLQDKKKKRTRDDVVVQPDMFNTQLFFGRASRDTNEAAITALFSQYGRLKEVLLFKERGTGASKGCGFVIMSSRAEADAAMAALNGTFTMEGSKEKFSVQWADLEMQQRKKHVPGQGGGGGMMMGQGNMMMEQGWQHPAGPIMYGQQYAGGYSQYGGQMMYAQQQPGYNQYGYGVSNGMAGAGGASAAAGDCKLYIGGVPHNYTEAELQPVLSPYGTITNLHILYHKETNSHKGAAFCTFSTPAECDLAIGTLHQKITLQGNSKPLIVKYAGDKNRLGSGGWQQQAYPAPAYGGEVYAQYAQPMVGYDQYQYAQQQPVAYGQQQPVAYAQPQAVAYGQQQQYAQPQPMAYAQQQQYAQPQQYPGGGWGYM
jgi:RNA recognition motif-containing protein